ncbi:MAG: FlgD immunoglobulin-like domain containing protein [Bacteroidota bacterium]|nr:FlgD immunoglobulin-like domain containing protein [Bacteroidota bacterium]
MDKLYKYVLLFLLLFLFQIVSFSQTSLPPHLVHVKKTGEQSFGCGFLEGGYASRHGVYQGEEICFFVSTSSDTFTLNIYRYGKTKEKVASICGLKGGIREVKEEDEVYLNGCNWPLTYKLTIPADWRAGAYIAEFPVQSDSVNPILFFVKEKDPSKRSKVIVSCALSDYHAYNMFGGKSAYPAFSSGYNENPGANYSVKLSFNRPFNRNNHNGVNRGSFFSYDAKLIKWLEEFGYGNDVDVIGNVDLDADPDYLYSHKVLLTCGHDEYWSLGMRDHVQEFVNRGGNFMCLSGNTCWWQVRFENNYRTMVCYKHLQDPIKDPALATAEWYKEKWEIPFLGTSYLFGGQTNYYYIVNGKPKLPGCMTFKDGYGGYIVYNSQHWAFKNSGLLDGDTLGFRGDSSIVGYESDGTLFKFNKYGIPVVLTPSEIPAKLSEVYLRRTDGNGTSIPQIPQNFRILGLSPANHHSDVKPEDWATMGIFKYPGTNSGFVFNAAAIRWVWGLYAHESKVSILTKNVLDHFLNGNFPPEITSWSPSCVRNDSMFSLKWPFNFRTKELQYGKNLAFSISALDYYNGNVKYAWAVNDSVVAEAVNNSYIYHSLDHSFGTNSVTAYAFNGKDTVSISWNIISKDGALAITSIPDTLIHIGQPYKYALSYYSKYNSKVNYTLDYKPKWAEFDTVHFAITGIPTCAKDSICVTAWDQLGNKDTQSFLLSDGEISLVKNQLRPVSEFYLFQNFPNPFNGSTRIRFKVKSLSQTGLVISDAVGRKIKSYSLGQIPEGSHEIIWDGNDDLGKPVSSGVYFYQVTFNNQNNESVNFSKKMVYMK